MQRKRIFRKSTKHVEQLKRSGAEEFAEEFPEGPLGAPPQRSERAVQMNDQNKKDKE